MAFTQFSQVGYFRVLESDTTTKLVIFDLQDGTELKHVMLTVFIRGLIASPFDMRLKIYGKDIIETAEITSQWATISMTTLSSDPAYTQNWYGNFYLDFGGEPLNPNSLYYMACETSGYTRNANSFYVAINFDWDSPVNGQIEPPRTGARIRILGDR